MPRWVYVGVWVLAGVTGVVECVLAAVMPVHADGTLYSYTEAGRSPAVFLYYAIYEATIAATVIASAIGCGSLLLRARRPRSSVTQDGDTTESLLLRAREPLSARVASTLALLTTVTGVAHACVGWYSMVRVPDFDHEGARRLLFLATLSLLASSLALGAVGSRAYYRREKVMVRLGIEIVEPLWARLTMLHPEVVLQVEPPTPMWRFLRLMIETHDAIHLIRYDTDPVIVNIINGRDPTDPRVTAELLVHLLGDSVIPDPPSWQARTMMRLKPLLPRHLFAYSLIELYRLHQALTTFYDPPNPPKDHTAYSY